MLRKVRLRRARRYRPSVLALKPQIKRLPRPRVDIDRALAWFVIWAGANVERRVEERLVSAGLSAYRPVEVVAVLNRGKSVERERNPLGRYVFVGLNADHPNFSAVAQALEPIGSVWTSAPLGRVLMVDGEALRVPASVLQRFADGLYVPEVSGGSKCRFASGDDVRVVSGPFASFLAEVESATDVRVRALVNVFGRKTSVELDYAQLEAA
jgi:transcription antitermination factor NusG